MSINLLSFSQPEPSEVLVSTEWLAEHIHEASLIILHAAAIRDDYAREHIPGARFLWNGWIAESNPERSYELPDAEKLDTLLEGLGISYNSRIVTYNDLQYAAGAVNIPSTSLFDSTGRYLPIDSLRTIFAMASINTGDEIIAYYYSGKAACPVYVAALNHSAHLYDGSFEEWSRKTELPVESGKSVH